MNKGIFIIILLTSLIVTSAPYAGLATAQQWSAPVRISNDLACFRPKIVCSNDILHLIYGSGQNRAFYQRSTDDGLTWSNPFRIDQGAPGITSGRPTIVANGDTVAGCWYHNFGGIYNLGFRKSLNGGANWGSVSFVLPSDVTTLHKHSFCLSDSRVFLLYAYYRADSIRSCFTKSTDLGESWSSPREIFAVDVIDDMELRNRGDTLLLLWSAAYSWQDVMELYFRRSTDGGDNWSNIQLLSTFDSSGSQNPCLALNERGELAAVWTDFKNSPHWFTGDVFVRYSSDLGGTWAEEQAITGDHLAAFPKAIWQADSLHLTWEDYFQDPGNISYMRSIDNGATWEQREAVDDTSADSFYPGVALTPGRVHLVWDERRTTEQGVFYSFRWEEPDAVEDKGSGALPRALGLASYPNPFNSNVSISYSLQNEKGGQLGIYNVHGQLITTFNLEGKEGRIKWDARDAEGNKASSGIYFARLHSGEAPQHIKLIYLK
jgi:hypothetical protein